MNFYKLERKFGRLAIPNLMIFIVITQFAVFVCDLVVPELFVTQYLYFSRDLILKGEVWRVLSFIFMPPSASEVGIVFSLYFSFLIGSYLERAWGTFKFNVYYFLGTVLTIAAGMITGFAGNEFLHLSLFFAFAIISPDEEIRLFFMIPIKAKYIACVDAVIYVVAFIMGSWSERAGIIAAIINLLIFFGRELVRNVKNQTQYYKTRRNFRSNIRGR